MRADIDAMRAVCGSVCSSHAFPSLYLWRDVLKLQYWARDGAFSARMKSGEWLFPCGSEAGRLAFLDEHGGEAGVTLRYVRAQDAAWLDAAQPGRWQLTRTPNDDEYLYDRAEHLRMEGGRYSSMRRHFHQIERDLGAYTVPLSDETAQDAADVLQKWMADAAEKGVVDPVGMTALRQWKELGMQGAITYLEGKPVTLMIGFFLSPEVFDMVVGKCILSHPGLTYYAMNHALEATCRTLDLEEDLGFVGLRTMKERYLPNAKIEFWEARRR